MDVTPRDPEDRSRLTALIRAEKDAMQRDRFRAIALALDGDRLKRQPQSSSSLVRQFRV